MEVLTKKDERVLSFYSSLNKMVERIENLLENYKPTLNGERFLTDKQLSENLKLSRRTLQDYRTQGKIPYIQMGGKTLYRESDVEKLLEDNFCKAWD